MMDIQGLDEQILLYIQEHLRVLGQNGFWKFISEIGNSGGIWIVLTLALLFFSGKTQRVGLASLLAIVTEASIVNLIIKPIVARPRPYDVVAGLEPLIEKMTDFSFPSGHTAVGFAFAVVMCGMAPKKFAVPAVVVGILTGYSRMYLGVHYPSDVLVGAAIGSLSGIFAVFLLKKKSKGLERILEKLSSFTIWEFIKKV